MQPKGGTATLGMTKDILINPDGNIYQMIANEDGLVIMKYERYDSRRDKQ